MVDYSLLLSLCSLIVSATVGFTNINRNKNKDTQTNVVEMTTVLIKLENIQTGVSQIEKNVNSLQETVKRDKEELIRLEERVKTLFNRENM